MSAMSEAPFTPEEETAIMRYLGYPDWQSLAQSMQLGFPAASQPLFLVRDSFKRMTGPARSMIRVDLSELDCIEGQISEARGRMRVTSMEGLHVNPKETRMLREELEYWTRRLEDDLGVKRNPYSSFAAGGTPGGINAKVG